MDNFSSSVTTIRQSPRLKICRNRRIIWIISGLLVSLSLVGIVLSILNPSIRAPLRPGLDFTGGTQIQLERTCRDECSSINTMTIERNLKTITLLKEEEKDAPSLINSRVQVLDQGKSIVLRLPFLSASQSTAVIDSLSSIYGPFDAGAKSVETIGPSLGGQLLRSSLVSLFVAFAGIAFYIAIRYDRLYAFLALIALSHDLIIVSGIFAWLGLILNLEVESLFAVSLLTIAGYSVNDTVVVFDRIREKSSENSSLKIQERIDSAVSATLTRTLYTSGTTLLPLLALIFFGGSSLYWFSISLSLGVIIGSWSSIALAPSLLSLRNDKQTAQNLEPSSPLLDE